MKNVIETLKYISKHGGGWSYDTYAGVWYLNLNYARSSSPGNVGFTKDELQAFLRHYNELIVENEKLKHCIKLLNEHYDEVTRCD